MPPQRGWAIHLGAAPGKQMELACYVVDGHPIALQNIRAPIFAVGTERDHVAPWHSVDKIHYLSDVPMTYALTSGGQNAGIVSEPSHPHRHFRIATKAHAATLLGADEWIARRRSKMAHGGRPGPNGSQATPRENRPRPRTWERRKRAMRRWPMHPEPM